jgi:chemotaxis protein MotA
MDFATLIGIISGIALVISSIMLNSGLELFWSPPSLMIVLGGTFAATLIAYPINELFRVIRHFLKVFVTKRTDHYDLIDTMVGVCNVARKGGVLAIESRLNQIDNKFLQKGLLLTVDGKDEATVNGLLRREINQVQKSHKDGWDIFNQMGKFSPAFGMIGTLIGLIQMLSDLDNVETVGPI